jgi:hypothetical protein
MCGEGTPTQPKHQVRDDHSGNASCALHKHIVNCFGPRNTTLNCVGESDRWIQVSARNRPERQNESDQRPASGNRVREQSNGDVSARQSFAHDPGANHSDNEERAANELSRQSGTQVEFH